MSLAETQRAASAVSLNAVVNGLVLAPLHPNVNYRGTKKKKEREEGVLPFTMGQVLSLKTNGWESLGLQPQE